MSSAFARFVVVAAVTVYATTTLAQTTPRQTDPTPPNPQAKPGATMVINPTEDECQKGWNSTLKWTQEQFEQFCTRLKAAK